MKEAIVLYLLALAWVTSAVPLKPRKSHKFIEDGMLVINRNRNAVPDDGQRRPGGNPHPQRFVRPNENPDLFQGDIIGVDHIPDRNAITSKKSRWPNGVIPYLYDTSVINIMPTILQAMKHIEDNTCIKFKPHDDSQSNHVFFFAGEGCYSAWGMVGGQQPISLGKGCGTVGMTLHEILHAVGFAHEQHRSDRDDYLIIKYENIMAGLEEQFVKLKPHQNWLINAFDYGSIMIYGDTAGSKDGYSKTMVAKVPGATFLNPDEKYSLSASDIDRINILYECPPK